MKKKYIVFLSVLYISITANSSCCQNAVRTEHREENKVEKNKVGKKKVALDLPDGHTDAENGENEYNQLCFAQEKAPESGKRVLLERLGARFFDVILALYRTMSGKFELFQRAVRASFNN